MKKLIATAAIVGATIFGATNIAGASAPTKNPLPRTWTPTATTVITTLVEGEPMFDDYDTTCVVDQIKAEFPSPRTFSREAKKPGVSPRISTLGMNVVLECDPELAS